MVLRVSDHPDAVASALHADRLDKLVAHQAGNNALLTEIRNLLKELIEFPRQEAARHEAQQKSEADAAAKAKADAERKKFEAQREAERTAQEAQRRPPETARQNAPGGDLFAESDAAPGPGAPQRAQTPQARNAEMAQQSDLEQQSQRDNVFHRDVTAKD